MMLYGTEYDKLDFARRLITFIVRQPTAVMSRDVIMITASLL